MGLETAVCLGLLVVVIDALLVVVVDTLLAAAVGSPLIALEPRRPGGGSRTPSGIELRREATGRLLRRTGRRGMGGSPSSSSAARHRLRYFVQKRKPRTSEMMIATPATTVPAMVTASFSWSAISPSSADVSIAVYGVGVSKRTND